jgi:hypothetical protein
MSKRRSSAAGASAGHGETKAAIYRRQAAEAGRVVESWPDSIRQNIIPPASPRGASEESDKQSKN